MGRSANGRSSIYQGKDGYWHGRVTVGTKDDGKPDRRHVMSKRKAVVTTKVKELEELRDKGRMPKAGDRWTVEKWLRHWIDNIAVPPTISENAHSGYRVDVEKHLIPGLGAHRLDKLAPEHCERLYAKIQERGLKAGTAHHVHRTLRNALNVAVKRRHLGSNPVLLATAPRLDEEEPEPYEIEEIKRLLKVAKDQERNGARWVLALALGLRQGEALGLKWQEVDLASGMIRIRRNRLRPKYAHGCEEAHPCGRKAGYCPQRKQTRSETGRTKSKAGRRMIGLPAPLVDLLKDHQAKQAAERETARQIWHEGGYVFTKPDGQPLNPNTDYHDWKALLKEAGLREARLHDARHTAATVLLILQVPTPSAMAIMGWSSASMAKRYQHMSDAIRSDVATRVGGLLWRPDSDEDGPDDDSVEAA
ncbi:site-specific integrase [Actinomadura barringtoniae]|uniref:Site-specific integrase n=1 Tax=Actinomadura barringtoniae TaxID=1427535 RepID=A0A939T8X8_9ACTN|nr:site-specific integrase [Actinomadura barringtoniae]MBO2453654.1 site-specific integrase [Actinomadura barringtoniae]